MVAARPDFFIQFASSHTVLDDHHERRAKELCLIRVEHVVLVSNQPPLVYCDEKIAFKSAALPTTPVFVINAHSSILVVEDHVFIHNGTSVAKVTPVGVARPSVRAVSGWALISLILAPLSIVNMAMLINVTNFLDALCRALSGHAAIVRCRSLSE